jgi:D-serine deaminase-like pyridoxal phosphate-dependent protein
MPATSAASLARLETPALILDDARMTRNIGRMRAKLAQFNVAFRPHVKTNKCIEVTRRLLAQADGPITVSTLAEADYFAAHGIRDIMYAVGIAPNKLAHVTALRKKGVALSIILDNADTAAAAVDFAKASGVPLDVLIEIDADGHRSGVLPDSPELITIGRLLNGSSTRLAGVMTHAGKSYDCRSDDAIRAMAGQERAAVVTAATRLREAGLPCPVVSVGSTPTALFADNLDGVTEVRAGVFVFFDLVMAGINVCKVDDIALSVLATVIGQQPQKGWSIVDAGWMAMSRDRGTANQPLDQGYGVVCDIAGRPLDDLIVVDANQEHGIIAARPGSTKKPALLEVGSQVRILPNHACATGAQYGRYHVVNRDGGIRETWERLNGW